MKAESTLSFSAGTGALVGPHVLRTARQRTRLERQHGRWFFRGGKGGRLGV